MKCIAELRRQFCLNKMYDDNNDNNDDDDDDDDDPITDNNRHLSVNELILTD